MIPLVAAVTLIFVFVSIFSNSRGSDDTWLYIVGIFPVIYGFGIYRGLKKQKRFLMNYSVTIAGNEITREQMNTPPLTISFMEIKEIIKSEKGNFTIRGASKKDIILIPHWIEDHAELEQQLQALAPITVRAKDPWHLKYRWALGIMVLGIAATLYLADNKILVGISGTILTGLIIWAIYEILTSRNVPVNAKRRIWVYFIVLASIIYVTYLKLTGIPLSH